MADEEVDTDAFLSGLTAHLCDGEKSTIVAMGFERNPNGIAYSWASKWEVRPEGYKVLSELY